MAAPVAASAVVSVVAPAVVVTAQGAAAAVPSAPEKNKPALVDPRVRLKALAAEAQACRRCRLGSGRTQACVARGSATAKVMFVGEAPGVDDDKQGLPFVGRAGQMLDRMIAAMGLAVDKDVYICNVLKCRPSDGRRPEAQEIAACMPYLHEQIALVKPSAIVALGNTAAMAVLETKDGIEKVRGALKLYRGLTFVVATYHPSYLLRPGPEQANARKTAWEDLQLVMKELGLRSPKGTDGV